MLVLVADELLVYHDCVNPSFAMYEKTYEAHLI